MVVRLATKPSSYTAAIRSILFDEANPLPRSTVLRHKRSIPAFHPAPLCPRSDGWTPQPQEKYERKGKGEWSYSYDDGRLIEKEERKGREYSYERKRGDSETKFKREKDGSWKEEITRHGCKTTREYKADTGRLKVDRAC